MDFMEWQRAVAAELAKRHNLDADRVRHREWMRFYVNRLSPQEAADRAHQFWFNSLPAEQRTRRYQMIKAKQTPRERLRDTLVRRKPGK